MLINIELNEYLLQAIGFIQPYRQASVSLRRESKLPPRFYGPFQIIEKIGEVAYKLDLPLEASFIQSFMSLRKSKVLQMSKKQLYLLLAMMGRFW